MILQCRSEVVYIISYTCCAFAMTVLSIWYGYAFMLNNTPLKFSAVRVSPVDVLLAGFLTDYCYF